MPDESDERPQPNGSDEPRDGESPESSDADARDPDERAADDCPDDTSTDLAGGDGELDAESEDAESTLDAESEDAEAATEDEPSIEGSGLSYVGDGADESADDDRRGSRDRRRENLIANVVSESDEGDADAGDESDDEVTSDESVADEQGADDDGSAEGKEAVTETGESATPRAETDGEGVVGRRKRREQEPTYPDPDDDSLISTPPDDEEMPLADHIEEMIQRLAVVLLFASVGTVVGLLWASDAIAHIWEHVMPQAEQRPPHIYHPLELWMTRIKVAALLGIMVGLPAFVYQCYLFMRPGLYPHERKYYLASVPTSVVLASVGMLFSYFIALPILFEYFTYYSEGSAEIHYALGETFNLVVTLTGFLAIVFQIPLFIMMAIMMGVTSRRWLADKRLYFWAGFFGLSFMATFDPTFMAAILVWIVMVLLFEGTLLLLKWVGVD